MTDSESGVPSRRSRFDSGECSSSLSSSSVIRRGRQDSRVQDSRDHSRSRSRQKRKDIRSIPDELSSNADGNDDDSSMKTERKKSRKREGKGMALMREAWSQMRRDRKSVRKMGEIKSGKMIEVSLSDRLGTKTVVKCCEDDTIGDLKKLVAMQVGTRPEKLRLQKWHRVFKDHITLADYEIHDGMGIELFYH